jgi:drug/metabolite transporter (DMT)-like permease
MNRLTPFLFVFLWSTGFIGARWGLPDAEPLSFLLVRYLCVIVLMLTIALLGRAPWPKEPRQWGHIGVCVFQPHSATDSDGIRPLIPTAFGHPFQ